MSRRRILIVGGSSVLGGGCAAALRGEGAELWLTHCRNDKGPPLRAQFPDAHVTQLDALLSTSVSALSQAIAERWGAIDGVVYAAGAGLLWPAMKTDDARWEKVFALNVTAANRVVREISPLLLQGRQPALVLISSIMGLSGAGGMVAYGASKAAVAGMARGLAMEWAPRGVRVNAVAPGIVPSPLVDEMFKYLAPEQRKSIEEKHPLGFGEASDVGHAVRFLLSPQSKWITGVVLPVDGGYTAL